VGPIVCLTLVNARGRVGTVSLNEKGGRESQRDRHPIWRSAIALTTSYKGMTRVLDSCLNITFCRFHCSFYSS